MDRKELKGEFKVRYNICPNVEPDEGDINDIFDYDLEGFEYYIQFILGNGEIMEGSILFDSVEDAKKYIKDCIMVEEKTNINNSKVVRREELLDLE